ncbi:putative integral membrane protein [Rhodopseudomonas palustris TIE-1]|uniref:hypothetical protein n=1 Tax=Rhodopseudomonas palustris TaxID=1076 RepID=UPI0001779884|nr:hypothetical protein [Rhodopseudomonas palustris]ACF02887.1 putative integral membrane protein [Rhodopseudomonas palustris TIE-1]
MTQSSIIRPSTLLRRALQADALVSGAMALLLSFGSGVLARLLALPQPLLLETGLFLIGYAALVGWLGTRRALPKALVLIVIAGNALWTLGSVALLLSGMVAPNALGVIFVLIQATAVGIFAELQFIGLKRGDATVAA